MGVLLVGLVVICVCVRKEVCLMGPVVMCSICEFWFLSIRLSCCSTRYCVIAASICQEDDDDDDER